LDLSVPESLETIIADIAYADDATPETYDPAGAAYVPSCNKLSTSSSGTTDYAPPHCYTAVDKPTSRPRLTVSGSPGQVLADLSQLKTFTAKAGGGGDYEWTTVTVDGVLDLSLIPNAPSCSSDNGCSRFFTIVLYRNPTLSVNIEDPYVN